jgi:threonine synthase
MSAYSYTDQQLRETIGEVFHRCGYLLDPHGAAGYRAVKQHSSRDFRLQSVFLETAHPGKFSQTVQEVTGSAIEIPDRLREATSGEKSSIQLSRNFEDFRDFLLDVSD